MQRRSRHSRAPRAPYPPARHDPYDRDPFSVNHDPFVPGGYARARGRRRRGVGRGAARYGPYDAAYVDRWPRAFDAAPPEYDRRGPEGDRRSPEGERRRPEGGRRRTDQPEWRERLARLRERDEERGWTSRAREFVRRYREPIIGLTAAGLAAPFAGAQRAAPEPSAPGVAERPAEAARRPGGVEAAVGERWARAEAEQIREDTVEGAMIRYGISRGLAEDIFDAAVGNDIDPDVAFGLVNTESSFDTRAISSVGARGLTQVMPRTADWLRPGTAADELFDRRLNLDLGFGYLRSLIDDYDGDLRLALLAYNRGPGTVDRVLERGGDPDNGYADKVLSG